MNLKYFFGSLIKSVHPTSYKTLSSRPAKEAFNHYFFVLILGLIVMVLFFIPFLFLFSSNLSEEFNKVEAFTLDANLSHSEPVVLLQHPRVVVDLDKGNLTREQVLINRDVIQYKPYVWFGKGSMELDSLADLKSHQEKAHALLVGFLVFLLPALVVFAFLALGISNLVLALLVSLIGFVLFKISHYHITYAALLKTALYATTVLLLAEIVLIYLYPTLLGLALLLYALLFLFASWSIAQRRFAIKRHKKTEFPGKK